MRIGLGGYPTRTGQGISAVRAAAEQPEEPLALRYHGHQFRVYNPDIGDGRGFLFAQLQRLRTACSTSAPRAAARRPTAAAATAA